MNAQNMLNRLFEMVEAVGWDNMSDSDRKFFLEEAARLSKQVNEENQMEKMEN